MTIKDTFLYFWCFLSNRDETKPWHWILFVLIAISGLSGFFIIINLPFILIGILGDQIATAYVCLLNEDFSILYISCSTAGIIYLLYYIASVFFMLLVIGVLIKKCCSDCQQIQNEYDTQQIQNEYDTQQFNTVGEQTSLFETSNNQQVNV
jgi:hypothetical protein